MRLQEEEIKAGIPRKQYDSLDSWFLRDCLKDKRKALKEWQKDLKYFSAIKEGKRKGHIYFIMNYDNGLYKIGRSKNPERRLKTLKANSGLPLILMHRLFTDDMYLLEKCAHNHFSFPPHERVYGEWFRIVKGVYASKHWLCDSETIFHDDPDMEILFADNNILTYQLHIQAIEVILRSREPEIILKL